MRKFRESHRHYVSSLESELRSVSGGDAAEDGSGDVEEREVEVQVGADVHRHHPVEPAEERGRLRVHQDDAHLLINQSQFTRLDCSARYALRERVLPYIPSFLANCRNIAKTHSRNNIIVVPQFPFSRLES